MLPVDRGRMLQPQLASDPWRLLVGCILLNQTARRQVDPVIDELFEYWDSPAQLARAPVEAVVHTVKPLGLYNLRAARLIRMSDDYCKFYSRTGGTRLPTVAEVWSFYGCGKYAVDSYRIFVLGHRPHPDEVKDKELKAFLADYLSAH